MDDLYALILAGGRGTRFWPLSRRSKPKQCLPIGGDQPLLSQAIDRLAPLVPAERVLVATGRDMESSVRSVARGIPSENILVEPWGRNTAPCIGWGTVEIQRRNRNGVVVVCPSDHLVENSKGLRDAIRGAAAAAVSTNNIVTLGVQPDRPETGFGYLQVGAALGTWEGQQVHSVAKFVEKPDPTTAKRYLESGEHLWNAGMFVFTVGAARDAYRAFLPRTAEALERLAISGSAIDDEWGNMDATSIDYGIMERCRHVLTIPLNVGWSDVGTWAAAGTVMPPVPGGRGVAGAVLQRDSSNCVIHAPGKTVALIGVDGVVVVDTEDALLVMRSDMSQQVGDIVRQIETNHPDEELT